MRAHLGRRQFNLLLGSGLAAGTVPGLLREARAQDDRTITVLNWQGYGTDEAWSLEAFKAATGITVQHDYFNSEPEMLTKLHTNPGVYDVVLINNARTSQALADGLIDPIDPASVPNAKDLAPALAEKFVVDGQTWGIAWLWGMTSLGVRAEKAAGVDSFAVLGDPAFAGRAALFDDSVSMVGIGALLTGQDVNAPADLEPIRATLKGFKPNVKLIWSSEDQWNKAFAAGDFDVSVYWSGAAIRSKRTFNLPVEFVVPKEGALGWLDGLHVPATSERKEDALAFINWMIDPRFYVEWSTKVGAPASANTAALAQLPPDDLNHQVHKPEYLTSLQFSAALSDETRQSFADLWEEVKASYAS
jgi:spermidine/putrescine transport system substrate-binding protein